MNANLSLFGEEGSLGGGFSSSFICGVDEAGRGCLAGPVVAAAVILPAGCELAGLDDSKRLSKLSRERLAPLIRQRCVSFGLGLSWPAEIDDVNILQATFLAMSRAMRALKSRPGLALIDGDKTVPVRVLPETLKNLQQKSIVGGDASVAQISAASVLAKTFRDKLMLALSRRYPGYGLEKHKGYATKEHYASLKKLGPSRQHRLTFAGVRPQEQLCLPGI